MLAIYGCDYLILTVGSSVARVMRVNYWTKSNNIKNSKYA